jgi:tetratricopeptide (TPR) repeat protein
MSLGVVKSALEIFERLEMWEEVVKCWGSMERSDKGVAIVHDLLSGRKRESETVTYRSKSTVSEEMTGKLDVAREAKLWCLLGDLEPGKAEEHYEKAWKVSGETSGRAIRSLGGYYFARDNFQEAIRCLRLAVEINPLLSRSWFILGCACVREEKWKEARDAFARCVSIDDEDAESWNNLASVYLRIGPEDKEESELVRKLVINLKAKLTKFPRHLKRKWQRGIGRRLIVSYSHSGPCSEVLNLVTKIGECG